MRAFFSLFPTKVAVVCLLAVSVFLRVLVLVFAFVILPSVMCVLMGALAARSCSGRCMPHLAHDKKVARDVACDVLMGRS